MSDAQILVLALAAVLVFWTLGAYNRLVALRNGIGEAWALVAEVLDTRGRAADALVAALREPLAAEQGALDALRAAQAQLRTAAEALAQRPVDAARAAALVAAEAALAATSARVLALLEQWPGWRGDAAVVGHATLLRDSPARLAFARQLYNQAAQAYDEAALQFPTRLLTGLFSFGPAGRL